MPKIAKRKVYLGIDPGASGGLAVIDGTKLKEAVHVEKMPETLKGIFDWFSRFSYTILDPTGVQVFAVIEQVTGYVNPAWLSATSPSAGNASARMTGSSMFSFGKSYGALLMALTGNDIDYQEVAPRTWQKNIGIIREKRELRQSWKTRLKEHAQLTFPEIRVTLATADALLLALHCKSINEDR